MLAAKVCWFIQTPRSVRAGSRFAGSGFAGGGFAGPFAGLWQVAKVRSVTESSLGIGNGSLVVAGSGAVGILV